MRLVPANNPDDHKKFWIDCYSPSVDLSNTTWTQKGLINKLPENAYGSHATKSIIKYRDKHSTTVQRLKKMTAILSKFTVLGLSSYFVVYLFKIEIHN